MTRYITFTTRLHSQYDHDILCVNLGPLAEEGGAEES